MWAAGLQEEGTARKRAAEGRTPTPLPPLTFIPSTLLAWASFIASSTRLASASAPWAYASSVMSTLRGSWLPVITTRTVSHAENPSNSALQDGFG